MTEPASWAPAGVDLDRPNAARIYDYYLGGAHNFEADRDVADAVLAIAPEVRDAARANRAFLRRAVRYALDHGVRQFLDLGSGIPTVGNVHEIAHAVDPAARVVYVDNDPVAVAHSQAILKDTDTVGVIQANIRDTAAILGHPHTERLIHFDQPVAVMLVSVLHFIPGDITGLVAALREAMASGSYLVISHASPPTTTTEQTDAVQELYARTPTPVHLRTHEQIHALFAGMELVHPNHKAEGPADLVPVTDWRPDRDDTGLSPEIANSPFIAGFLAGLARTPSTPNATTWAAARPARPRNPDSHFDPTRRSQPLPQPPSPTAPERVLVGATPPNADNPKHPC